MTLRAVVLGAGWAGEGHTTALREAGVDVVAMSGRTPEPAKAMAAKLGIADLRFDWRQAIEALTPDIVSIATPGITHREMAVFAAQQGCHIVCDKPLGLDAGEARSMLAAVEEAGVKHAYAASSRYAPECILAREALVAGLIGELQEVESIINLGFSRLAPYMWLYRLDQGGGTLNNGLPHPLAQALYISGAQVTAVAGEARRWIDHAPIGETIHDFRNIFGQSVAVNESTEWRAVDADTDYKMLARLELPGGHEIPALFKCSLFAASRHPDSLAFYGEKGTLYMSGGIAPNAIEHFDKETGEWRDLSATQPTPSVTDGGVQRNWNRLVGEFVAHVQESGTATYPTFRDGWKHNEIIDIVRSGSGWTSIPASPAPA